jgi:hypothetical protein
MLPIILSLAIYSVPNGPTEFVFSVLRLHISEMAFALNLTLCVKPSAKLMEIVYRVILVTIFLMAHVLKLLLDQLIYYAQNSATESVLNALKPPISKMAFVSRLMYYA